MEMFKQILFVLFVLCIPPIVLQMVPIWTIVNSNSIEDCVCKGGFIHWVINEITLEPETRKLDWYTQFAFNNRIYFLISMILMIAFYTLMFYLNARHRKQLAEEKNRNKP